MDPWLPILKKLSLTKAEEAVVKRYAADPLGRTFLPIADILRSHKLIDESVELLLQGVQRHPGFTVARVVLARELFLKGMCEDAWMTLEGTSENLNENVLAQKLYLKLAIVLDQEARARQTFNHIKNQRMFDDEVLRVGEALEVMNFKSLRDMVIKDLKKSGIPLIDPPANGGDSQSITAPVQKVQNSHAPLAEPDIKELNDARINGFHVLPLREIFATAWGPEAQKGESIGGVELDSLTLLEIFMNQGHYQKALEVCRRLLKLMPGSDLLKRKIQEITRLRDEQRVQDLAIDPHVVDKMSTVEVIDNQLRFLQELLERI